MPQFQVNKVIGFDIRRVPILNLGGPKRLGEYWPTDHPISSPYPPTITQQTWPRGERCANIEPSELNSLDLLFLPDAQFRDRGAISVAFSVSSADADVVEENGWILPIDEGHLSQSLGWQLLGYDIADAGFLFSGFYGFTWKPGEMASLFTNNDLVFNRYGLLDGKEDADRAAEIFSNHPSTESHAPFYPVRVWVQGLEPAADIARKDSRTLSAGQ